MSRVIGKVKWFNNKSGFGFITVLEGENKDRDIFVHFSSVHVPDTQYRYLVQGEYVEVELVKPERGDHDLHAVNVTGPKGGDLMCETRRLNQEKAMAYEPRQYKTTSKPKEEDGFVPVTKKRVSKVAVANP